MKQIIIITGAVIVGYYILLISMAYAQSDLDSIFEGSLSAPIVYDSMPDMIRIGQNIYSQGFEDALTCMSVIYLRYEYGDPDATGLRPSVNEMQDRCRVRYNLNE